MTSALATLALGCVIGYLGQRSGLCFVAGYRDLLLTGDGARLGGIAGTLLGAVAGYVVFGWLGGSVPDFPIGVQGLPGSLGVWAVLLVSAVAIGVVSAFAGGCPFRMHVQAAEGRGDARYYLAGLYLGLLFFNVFTGPLLEALGVAG